MKDSTANHAHPPHGRRGNSLKKAPQQEKMKPPKGLRQAAGISREKRGPAASADQQTRPTTTLLYHLVMHSLSRRVASRRSSFLSSAATKTSKCDMVRCVLLRPQREVAAGRGTAAVQGKACTAAATSCLGLNIPPKCGHWGVPVVMPECTPLHSLEGGGNEDASCRSCSSVVNEIPRVPRSSSIAGRRADHHRQLARGAPAFSCETLIYGLTRSDWACHGLLSAEWGKNSCVRA